MSASKPEFIGSKVGPQGSDEGLSTATGRVRRYLAQMTAILGGIDESELTAAVDALWKVWSGDRTAFIVGNGGSAATASHMANDLSKQTQLPGFRPLRAHSLADSTALITAFGNDVEYARVFAEQLRIHGRPGDLLVCISCSGSSPNIVAAIEEARALGIDVVALGGFDGGAMRGLSDVYVHVPSDDYGMIESAHLVFDHCLTALLLERGQAAVSRRPVVFVDRDGVIIRNRKDHVKSWAEVEWVDGALEGLALLTAAGHRVYLVTNQSVVGRGLVTASHLEELHGALVAKIAASGGRIDGVLVCPHAPDAGCDCRKPQPGLLLRARDEHGLDLSSAYLIGDFKSDIEAASAAGCASVLVLSGRTSADGAAAIKADHTVADLLAAAQLIIGETNSGPMPEIRFS